MCLSLVTVIHGMKPQFILYQPNKIEKMATIANQEQNSFVADDGNYGSPNPEPY